MCQLPRADAARSLTRRECRNRQPACGRRLATIPTKETTNMHKILAALALALAAAAPSLAQKPPDPYPSRPVRLAVPFSAGSTSDTVARGFAERLAARFGQPFNVENKPRAGRTVGAALGPKSQP